VTARNHDIGATKPVLVTTSDLSSYNNGWPNTVEILCLQKRLSLRAETGPV
jgi:hypothetical protein